MKADSILRLSMNLLQQSFIRCRVCYNEASNDIFVRQEIVSHFNADSSAIITNAEYLCALNVDAGRQDEIINEVQKQQLMMLRLLEKLVGLQMEEY